MVSGMCAQVSGKQMVATRGFRWDRWLASIWGWGVGQMVGIDLGKTNCRMARLKAPADAEIIVNRDQLEVMPTLLVAHPDGDILVGRAAAATGLAHPEWVVPELLSALKSGNPVQVGDAAKPPEELLAHLFRRLKSDAEMRCGGTVSGAVVAHPTTWNETAREDRKSTRLN